MNSSTRSIETAVPSAALSRPGSRRRTHRRLAGTAALLGLGMLITNGMAAGQETSGKESNVIQAAASDGGQLQFDGVYYDYRDANAQKAMKLWVPPGPEPMRGILFHGNPGGGGGDTRSMARDPRLQEFAARHRLGIIGVTWFPGRKVYSETAKTMIQVLHDWAKLGRHPEITNLPLITRGNSNAGVTAYGLTCYVPERMICFTPNVGPAYNPPTPPAAALKVPGLLHIGPKDPFFKQGMEDTANLFAAVRPQGALWAWDAEQNKGHEIRHVDDVDLVFYDTCLGLRLPADADPRRGPVPLRDIKPEDGWLVDLGGWESGFVPVAPYNEYRGDKAKAGWVPSKDIAYLYRAIASYHNPLKIGIRDFKAVENTQASGALLRSVGGSLVEAGAKLVLECDAAGLPGWEKIEFYNGADKLGEVKKGQPPQCEFVVDPKRTVYGLLAVGYDAQGKAWTSYPLHVLVRDPKVSAALDAQRKTLETPPPGSRPAYGSSAASPAIPGSQPTVQPDDGVLVAYGLSAEDEKLFAGQAGQPAAFWGKFAEGQDRAVLDFARHQAAQASESRSASQPVAQAVAKADAATVVVKAAHSRAGLYLYFEVTDRNWSAVGDLADALDFHIARDSSAVLRSAPTVKDKFQTIQFFLPLSEVQYQSAFGTVAKPAKTAGRNLPSPWDMRHQEDTLPDLQTRYGIVVRQSTLAPDRRVMEWFIPWDYVGNGGPWAEPAVGARLGLVLGYNDAPAEKGGPTINLRWPNGLDPWAVSAENRAKTCPWGDLEIGPMLKP